MSRWRKHSLSFVLEFLGGFALCLPLPGVWWALSTASGSGSLAAEHSALAFRGESGKAGGTRGRACFPPRAGATCRWRGVGSWELVSCLWAASSIIQLADRREWWWGCRKDLPLLRHASWRGSLEFQPGARLVAQLKAWASFASKIHRRLSPWKCRIALGKEDKSQRTKADLFFLLWVSEDGVGQDKKAVTCWEVSARAGDRRLVLPGVQCFVAA